MVFLLLSLLASFSVDEVNKGCNVDRLVFVENNFFSLKPRSFVHSFIYSFLHFFVLPFHPCQSARAAASYKVVNCSVAHKG